MIHNTIQHSRVWYSYCTIQYNKILYCSILDDTMKYCTVWYRTIQYDKILNSTMRHNTMQCISIGRRYVTTQYLWHHMTPPRQYSAIPFGTIPSNARRHMIIPDHSREYDTRQRNNRWYQTTGTNSSNHQGGIYLVLTATVTNYQLNDALKKTHTHLLWNGRTNQNEDRQTDRAVHHLLAKHKVHC